MSKKKKNTIKGHFVPLPDYMTNSKAWKKLTCRAVWVYIEIHKKYKGDNKDDLSLTYNEVKYKMSTATYSKCIKELVKYGFIDIIKHGGLFRNCSIYALSNRWIEINKILPTG